MKILIVDDDAGLRKSIGLILDDAGYEVVTALDGAEGLEVAQRERPDLILCDVRMPKVDGLEFLDRHRASGLDSLVLVMTAYGSIQDAVTAMKEGAMDFLAKPVDPDHLLLLVERAIAQRRMAAEYYLLKEEMAERRGAPRIIGEARAAELLRSFFAVRR